MKPWLMCACLLMIVQPSFGQDKKIDAEEKATRRLVELLTPGAQAEPYRVVTEPLLRDGPRHLEHPEVPLPVFKGTPPHLSLPGSKPVPPRDVPEPVPLMHFRGDAERPEEIELPAGPLVRLPSVNVEQPMPLPILAQPQRDRAALTDPTLEASIAAALAPVSVNRAAPVPFAPINLPDPFEHSQAIRLRQVPDELADPVIIK